MGVVRGSIPRESIFCPFILLFFLFFSSIEPDSIPFSGAMRLYSGNFMAQLHVTVWTNTWHWTVLTKGCMNIFHVVYVQNLQFPTVLRGIAL